MPSYGFTLALWRGRRSDVEFVGKEALTFSVRRFLADLLKERLPDLGHGHAVKAGKLEGSSEGDFPFVLLDFVQGRNGEAGPL